jgi:hypothetical protein
MKLLNEVEAAQYLRIKLETLRWMRWREQGPTVIKIGRTPVYDQVDLDAYIESCRGRSPINNLESRRGLIQKAG